MRTHVFFIFFVLATSNVVAQSPPSPPYTLPVDPTNLNVIPLPPETSAFMRYGEYRVSKENGLPEISIPIHTLTEGQLSASVALTYHAAGVKVDEKASWCGLLWSIQQGGMISRTVRGHPDEALRGYLNVGIPTPAQFEPYDAFKYDWIKQIIAGESDSEPDEFNFSLPGASGRFFFDPDGIAVTQPFSNVAIEPTISDYNIIGFTITTPDGIKYKFGQPCTTGYNTNHLVLRVYANTTWYLEEISSPNSQDKIKFYYRQKAEYTETRFVATDYITYSYTDELYAGHYKRRQLGEIPYTMSLVKEIDYIESSTGKIVFNSSPGRLDGDFKLDAIDIYGADKLTVIKGFDFKYQYFESEGGTTPNHYRLKLVSVQERGKGGVTIPPYEFTYQEDTPLPPRYSFQQDYWGYNNGKLNASLLPVYKQVSPSGEEITLGDADRNSDPYFMKLGIIRTVKYPTQGYTEFAFESNTIKRTYIPPPQSKRFNAFIYPPGTGSAVVTEHFADVPGEGQTMPQNRTASVDYQIQQVLGEVNTSDMSVQVKDMTTGAILFEHTAVTGTGRTTTVQLQAGHSYRVYARSNLNQTTNRGLAAITVSWEQASTPVIQNLAVGGLRIQSIKNYNETNELQTQKVYLYTFPSDPNASSGSYNTNFLPEPNSFVGRRVSKWIIPGTGSTGQWTTPCRSFRDEIVSLTSTAFRQQIYAQGPAVTYEYVTELFAEPANNLYGKTVYKYDLFKDEAILGPIYEGGMDMSSLRGQIRREEYYDNTDRLIKSKTYDYEVIENVKPMLTALKVGLHWEIGNNIPCLDCASYDNLGFCWEPEVVSLRRERVYSQSYYRRFHWKRVSSITAVADGVPQVQTFQYHAANQHTSVVTAQSTRSDGRQERINIRYAHDVGEAELLNRNITGAPLESDVFLDGQLTGGTRLTYDFFGNYYIPRKFEERLTDGTYSGVGLVDEVNAKGRITLSHNRSGIYTGILWGYGEELPVAKITISRPLVSSSAVLNPTYSTVPPGETSRMQFAVSFAQQVQISTEILDPGNVIGSDDGIYKFFIENRDNGEEKYFHKLPGTKSAVINLEAGNYIMKSSLSLGSSQNIITNVNVVFIAKEVFHNSFEEFGVNDPDAKTGDKVHDGDYVIHGKMLVPGQYVLSYFENTGTGWVMNKRAHVHDGASDLTILSAGKIDEVRIHPEGSQMETTTYDPVSLRVTSKTNVNGITSYYFYDDLGRLTHISDDDRDIVGSMQYHYMND